jgi:sugar lactone lactonase YvrE
MKAPHKISTLCFRKKIGMVCRAAIFAAVMLCVVSGTVFEVSAGDTGQAGYRLTEQWQTTRELRVPESILYNEREEILYVSNINGKPTEKNGLGFISRVTLDGKIEALKWAIGLNAPKGAAIFEGRFYVSDIDRLVEIELASGRILASYPAAGAGFLNDVAVDTAGNVYVTDMSTENSVIYRLHNGKLAVWLKNASISKPNGLHMEKGRLVVGNSGDGHIKAVDLSSRVITTLARVGSGIDGLRPDGRGNYFVSDWQGKTSLVTAAGDVRVLMDTTAAKINAADLEYVEKRNLLLIPTFFDNRVVAYRVSN